MADSGFEFTIDPFEKLWKSREETSLEFLGRQKESFSADMESSRLHSLAQPLARQGAEPGAEDDEERHYGGERPSGQGREKGSNSKAREATELRACEATARAQAVQDRVLDSGFELLLPVKDADDVLDQIGDDRVHRDEVRALFVALHRDQAVDLLGVNFVSCRDRTGGEFQRGRGEGLHALFRAKGFGLEAKLTKENIKKRCLCSKRNFWGDELDPGRMICFQSRSGARERFVDSSDAGDSDRQKREADAPQEETETGEFGWHGLLGASEF